MSRKEKARYFPILGKKVNKRQEFDKKERFCCKAKPAKMQKAA